MASQGGARVARAPSGVAAFRKPTWLKIRVAPPFAHPISLFTFTSHKSISGVAAFRKPTWLKIRVAPMLLDFVSDGLRTRRVSSSSPSASRASPRVQVPLRHTLHEATAHDRSRDVHAHSIRTRGCTYARIPMTPWTCFTSVRVMPCS